MSIDQDIVIVNNHLELRLNKDGSVDEIVLSDANDECILHLEQMDDNWFWARLYSTEQLPLESDVIFQFSAVEGHAKVVYRLEESYDKSKSPLPEYRTKTHQDGLLRIMMQSMIRRFGIENVERVLADVK